MCGAAQELDLEPQKSSILTLGFGDRNFFISFFGGRKSHEMREKRENRGILRYGWERKN
jgi:hypothetical protein